MSEKKIKKSLLVQGGILAGAGLITKIIGFIYRIPMSNILGEQGNGVYSVAFGIYNVALTLSSYSMPLAVSKLVAARLAKNEGKNAKRVFLDALLFAILVGTIAMLALYFGADALEGLYKRQGLAKPLHVLAPTTFVVALLGTFRGYFQGHRNMVPTALSQIFEQIANAIVSVVAAYGFMKVYATSEVSFAYGAMGGTMGTLSGAFVALVYFVILYLMNKSQMEKEDEKNDFGNEIEGHAMIYKALLLTILPVILSQTIYQLGYTIDDIVYGNLMALKGYEEAVASSLQGVFNTQYNQLINLPVAISAALASSTIPSMVASKMKGDKEDVFAKITLVVKVNMLIAFPCAVGMAVLSTPIMKLLFPRLVTYQATASMLLLTGSFAIVFYALSTITTSILQGNDYMRLPVIHSGISLVIHVVLITTLLYFTDWNVYALVIGNVTFPMIVSFMNCYSISKKIGYQWNVFQMFVKPLVASAVMGIFTYLVYFVIRMFFHGFLGEVIATGISVGVSIVVYAIVAIKIKCLGKEEVMELPGGRTLAAKLFS